MGFRGQAQFSGFVSTKKNRGEDSPRLVEQFEEGL
jgi:hypothetical protein